MCNFVTASGGNGHTVQVIFVYFFYLRNFEGRINPHTRANYLASPPLCIAYAIAPTVLIDFEKEPQGKSLMP